MDHLDVNRALWDERVPIHVGTELYDVPGFLAGRDTIEPMEDAELGDLTGLRVAHLQCHFGMDTLSLARRGATVVGLDFSEPAIAQARALAEQAGIAGATFVHGTVESARELLEDEFDLVYTTWGVLIWLPDLDGWARTVASLLRPGGWLYLAEGHPYAWMLKPVGDGRFEQEAIPYGGGARVEWDEPGTYADEAAPTEHTKSVEFQHGLGEIVTAVATAGLRIDFLHEHDAVPWRMWDGMVQGDDRLYRLPGSSLPVAYSLRATR